MSALRGVALELAALALGLGALAGAAALATPAPSPAREVPRVAPPASDDADLPMRAPSVASYVLHARLDDAAHRIEGEGTIRLTNVSSRPLDELWFHLYLNAFESDETVFGRAGATGFRGNALADRGSIQVASLRVPAWDVDLWPSVSPTTPGDAADRTSVRVPLPRPLAVGATLELEVRFTSQLPALVLRTGFAGDFHMAGQWFPKLAKLEPDGTFAAFPFERHAEFYADFGAYDVTVDVPERFVVGATGARVEERVEGGRRVVRHTQESVHDFAFVAWPGFVERLREANGVRLRALVPRGHEASAELELDAAARGLAHFGERFGRYPHDVLTLVHPPTFAAEAGGMEYPTLITLGGAWWLGHAPARALESLTLHELGHQWFQGVVASNEREHPFLDEGLTTWAAADALAALYPESPISALAPAGRIESWERAIQLGIHGRAAVATPARDFATGGDYARFSYWRPATLFRSIDGAYDGAMSRAVMRYARTHRFGHPRPSDLVAALRVEAGDDAARALELALFERAFLDHRVLRASSTRHDAGHEVDVVIGRSGALALPVEIELEAEDGSVVRERWEGGGDALTLRNVLPAPLVRVRIDPDGKLPIDEDRRNDAWAREVPWALPRTLVVSLALARLGLAGVGP